MSKNTLPQTNELNFYEIRMESIGGLGANLAGKMLADAGMIGMGYNGAAFASYGSEKKGSPVKAYVRFGEPETEVRINQAVDEPHMLVIFHETLIEWLPVTMGVRPNAKVVVNTSKTPEEMRKKLKLHGGTVCCVDAIKISLKEKVKVNTIMLGAIAEAAGFINKDKVKKVIRNTFEAKYPHLVEPNIRGFERGGNELVIEEFKPDSSFPFIPYEEKESRVGYASQPMGGILPVRGNNAAKNLSSNRVGLIPLWLEDKCKHCAQCDLICPDICFVWEEETKDGKTNMFLKGIDYDFCKGCLKCVDACPFNAIEKAFESEHDVSKLTVKKYPELKKI